jgi:hypothetical protein
LENRELNEHLLEFFRGAADLSASNVVDRLSLCEYLEESASAEIDYLASHFYEMDVNIMKNLNLWNLLRVLSSEKLTIVSEDSLLDFILDFGMDGLSLLGCVRSEYLSISGIDRLLNSISLDDINPSLWSSLCRRLRSTVAPVIDASRFYHRLFPLESSRPFEGIISYLTRESGGNVHTQGIVSITASSNYSSQCYQVADYDWSSYWISADTQHSWIKFDFKNRKISLTDYSIKSGGQTSHLLVNWSIDGSNDDETWMTLDRRNTQDLNERYAVKSYRCESSPSSGSFFRFIRLTQVGPNSSNQHYLLIANVEFFGDLVDAGYPFGSTK